MMVYPGLPPSVETIASEVFSRSWQFIESDPVLAGQDRQVLQEHLAELVLRLMADGDRSVVVIANRAIGTLRQQYTRERAEAA